MSSSNIHILKKSAQDGSAPARPNALKHLDAAHEKLMQLQAWRRQYKIELAECIEQRDDALRELDDSKTENRRQAEILEEYTAIIEAQAKLIVQMRADRPIREKRRKRAQRDRIPEDDGPALTAMAIHRHRQLENISGKERQTDDRSAIPSQSNNLTGLIRRFLGSY